MKCPACGSGKVEPAVIKTPFTYKQQTLMLEERGDLCADCGEMLMDLDECRRLDTEQREFVRKINAAYVDSGFIASVRKKLGLDQKRAAQLFGGGVNAFSRYEHGKAKPPLALIQLFRLLDKNPELLKELL